MEVMYASGVVSDGSQRDFRALLKQQLANRVSMKEMNASLGSDTCSQSQILGKRQALSCPHEAGDASHQTPPKKLPPCPPISPPSSSTLCCPEARSPTSVLYVELQLLDASPSKKLLMSKCYQKSPKVRQELDEKARVLVCAQNALNELSNVKNVTSAAEALDELNELKQGALLLQKLA